MIQKEQGPALQTGVVPEPEGASDMLVVSEINRSMWSCAVNNALKKEEGEIGEHSFMGVSLEINGRDMLLAQGIWNKDEAQKVKDGIKDNKPRVDDYSEYELKNGVKRITFTSNTKVINYLIENKIFVKDKNLKGRKMYKLTYYPILGQIEELSINLDIHLLESSKKGFTFVVIDFSEK